MNKVVPILTINNVPLSQKWMYETRKLTFNKDLNLKGKYCHHVYNTITIDTDGLIFRCICHAWIPIIVGNILDFQSFEEILDHQISKNIVNSIEDGSYRYCDHTSCGLLISDLLLPTKPLDDHILLNLALDESCNLSCPSCRTNLKFISEDNPKYSDKKKIIDHLITLVNKSDKKIIVSLAGDGDPFASLLYRQFISNLNNKNLEVEINTNGILIKDFWSKLEKIHPNIIRLKISIDAGSQIVYEVVRRGGSWTKLLESLNFITAWRNENPYNFELIANFVLQSRNFTDIVKYVQLCLNYDFNLINFQKIQDWGTYIKDFESLEVWRNDNVYYEDFVNIMRDPILKNSKINFTNLQEIYNEITRTS